MAKDTSFRDYVLYDLLKYISGITSRAMFGGWGIYKNGVIFSIIAENELYFKVGESTRADFEQLGSYPFVYSQGNHKPTTMSYWLLPEQVMENSELLQQWVERAVHVSQQSKKPRRLNSNQSKRLPRQNNS